MPAFSWTVADFIAFTKIKSADVNSMRADVVTFLNTTKLDSTNVQLHGLSRDRLAAGTAYGVVSNDSSGYLTSIAPSTANNVLKSDGTQWLSGTVTTPNQAVAAKTANYTAQSTDDIITCDSTGGTFTISLPAAASNTGKVLRIKKIDNNFTAITIDGNSSETIDGALTTTLNTQYESITIACDGSNWITLDRRIPSAWFSVSPAFVAMGTTSSSAFVGRRVGDSLEIVGTVTTGTCTSSAAAVTLPSSLVMDTNKLPAAANLTPVGTYAAHFSGTGKLSPDNSGVLFFDGSDTANIYFAFQTSSSAFIANSANALFNNATPISVRFIVPISGWKA